MLTLNQKLQNAPTDAALNLGARHAILFEFVFKNLGPIFICACLVWLIYLSHILSWQALTVLATGLFCIWGWCFSRLPDSFVALAGALALVFSGSVSQEKLFATLGDDLVWLMVAGFVIAAIVKASGLLDVILSHCLSSVSSIRSLFYVLTLFIAITAFIIPSTSARAALLLPVFLALAERLPHTSLIKPIGILFPTVILLSAGGSLMGAGAHLVAVDAVARTNGVEINYVRWFLMAFPPTIISSIIGCWLIIVLFVQKEMRNLILAGEPQKTKMNGQQKRVLYVLLAIVVCWATHSFHGVDIALVAIGGMLLLMSKQFCDKKPKELFKSVEVELIIFLAASSLVASAATNTGLDKLAAEAMLAAVPAWAVGSKPIIYSLITAVAIFSHLAINSRSARAAVLIPAFALPLAGLGHEVQTIVMLAILGTGFCQTTMASAKPVAIFASSDNPAFSNADLLRLALPLAAAKFAILLVFALFVWPHVDNSMPEKVSRLSEPEIRTVAYSPRPVEQRTNTFEIADPKMSAIKVVQPNSQCSKNELRLVMLSEINTRKMWAHGWWHVWNRLVKRGFKVERKAVKDIYRGEDMVRLRAYSPIISQSLANKAAVAAAQAACRGV